MRFREQTTETAGFYNTVGFNDDTRAFLSIPSRHDVARRIAAARATFPQMPGDEEAWRGASFLVGTPDEVVEQIRVWEDAGVQRMLLQMLDQEDLAAIELFARQVLPRVR